MMFVAMGMNVNVYTVYSPYVIARNGFTNAQGSSVMTIRYMVSALGVYSVDMLYSRIGLRKTIALGLLFEALSRVIFALSRSFALYCVGAALAGFCYGWCTTMPVALLVGRWFRSHRGKALGFSTLGSGVATIAASPLVALVIEKYSLATAFFSEAALAAVLAAVVYLILRDRPEDMGLEPYDTGEKERQKLVRAVHHSLPAKTGWIFLYLSIFLMSMPAGPASNHLTVLLTTQGYPERMVANLMAYCGVMNVAGRYISGKAIDRFGGKIATYIVAGAMLLYCGLGCLTFMGGSLLAWAIMTFAGINCSMIPVIMPVWTQDFLQPADYEKGVQKSVLFYSLCAMAFNTLPGLIADWSGSYIPAYAVFTVFSVLCLVVVGIMYGKIRRNRLPVDNSGT